VSDLPDLNHPSAAAACVYLLPIIFLLIIGKAIEQGGFRPLFITRKYDKIVASKVKRLDA